MLKNAPFLYYTPLQVSVQMRKIAITLKIVQIDEKYDFFPIIFFREKARQFGNLPRLRIQTLDNFYIPSFASKLLLKEVICKKPVKNVCFQQKSSTYHDFSHLNAYL